jgi:hypothetical protein
MRTLVVAALLLAPLSLFAQEKRNSLYVFIANPEFTSSETSGTNYSGAFGVALQHKFRERWSGELTIARQRQRTGILRFDPQGNVIERQTFYSHSIPVDLAGYYHFLNDSAWKPYLGLAARYVAEEGGAGGIGGGVLWRLRPAFGIRFDGKLLLGNRLSHMSSFNGAVGVAWSF